MTRLVKIVRAPNYGTQVAITPLIAGRSVTLLPATYQEDYPMRCMKLIMVVGEVVFFGLVATSLVRGAEFPALRPTFVAARPAPAASPVRVSMTNSHGQVTTLEYHSPVRVIGQNEPIDDGLVPIRNLPVLSSPARETDLPLDQNVRSINYQQPLYPEITSLSPVRYAGQPVSAAYPQTSYYPQTSVAGTPLRPVANCACQTPVNNAAAYPPVLSGYPMPGYVGAPQTVYSPLTPITPVTVAQSNIQVGSGIYGQPVIYRPGQPVRNAWRWLTP